MKLNGRSNQSQRITKRKKYLNQQKLLKFLLSEIEIQRNENKSIKLVERKYFFKINLKVIKTNSYQLKSFTSSSFTYSGSN